MNAASLVRALHRSLVGAATVAALPLRRRDGSIEVFYGGARGGHLGGPLVKVALLREFFPERRVGFSLLYVLSNAIYLPRQVIELLRASRVPIVLNQNGVFYPAWYPVGWERENARMARVHELASHVFYQSEFCRRSAARFLGQRSGPGEILYNAVDTSRFAPAPIAASRPFTFLVTGKIGPSTAYRLTSSIAGFAAARANGLDVRLRIAGGIAPDVLGAAHRLAEQLGVSHAIEFGGPYRRADAPAVYRAADAYLITKHNDPCPNVVLEALASGLPVLYSASGGAPELVGSEAGVGLAVPETFDETPVPSPLAIAEGMARIMGARAAMAQAARERAVARFGLAHWIDRHRQIFQSLVGAAC